MQMLLKYVPGCVRVGFVLYVHMCVYCVQEVRVLIYTLSDISVVFVLAFSVGARLAEVLWYRWCLCQPCLADCQNTRHSYLQ